MRKAIGAVIDDWHQAAAAADEERYFGHLSRDAVFMGTDASERWSRAAFRAYAKPHFDKGKAWSFKAIRRSIHIETSGLAWFDEDLATPNLGPARGSGVVRSEGIPPRWRIVHYNLSITIPNDRFGAVRKLLSKEPPKLRGR